VLWCLDPAVGLSFTGIRVGDLLIRDWGPQYVLLRKQINALGSAGPALQARLAEVYLDPCEARPSF
jgi:hypothetical protein